MNTVKKVIILISKGILGLTELLFAFLVSLVVFIILVSKISPPEVDSINIGERKKVGENHYTLGNNWLKKNKYGIWEMYIEGAPYERGLIYGELGKELIQKQEDIFVGQINDLVPSQTWQHFLRLMIGFFNRDLPANIPLENQQEIFGISQSFSDQYNYISSKYSRILNYHAAHDIGHALNDYSMVGCTSFALNQEMTDDGSLLVGRNFDFYVGDEFAKEKLVLFIKPEKGIPFVSYSWAGFTGVVSGLNNEGLSVTINASKSDLPVSTKTPISLLAREILQYARNIDEAIAIAKKRNTFVSETLLISSKKDGKAILIEKSPTKLGVFKTESSSVICSNHYQSAAFSKDKINVSNIELSDSKYRYNRVKELLNGKNKLDNIGAVDILRDQLGENGDTLGMGNPRAINQLIAHHSVIIRPELGVFYVSTQDYQLGEFVGYNLNSIFNLGINSDTLSIGKDPFLNTEKYKSFKKFKQMKSNISKYVNFGRPYNLTDVMVRDFINSNSESYVTYEMLGRYYLKKKQFEKAIMYFKQALTKNVASLNIENELKTLIKECKK